ncbi:MAG: radical SAM protein [Candidatus Gracilibacteria bacterium]|nr:radical SAM protein [Candidatus Gracilibacteria bacterium]
MFKLLDLHIVIYLSYDCNLRCSYCVINFDKFVMNDTTINQISGFIVDNYSKFKNVFVEFIGGEPLLQREKIIKIISSTNISPNIKFQITTNGTIIDDHIYNSFIVNIDKVNLSYNENYFDNNKSFVRISDKIKNKNNININFIYDPRKNLEDIKNNFLFVVKQGYKSINILPIVLVYKYEKNDFENLISFINFVLKFKYILNLEFIYYIQEKSNHFEFTINPDGSILGDNMGTAEQFFGVKNNINKSIGYIGNLNFEEIYDNLQNYSYIDYLKNISITGNVNQDYKNLLFLSNLLKKYNDKESFRNI